MSTNHTPNYSLNQWEKSDKVLMEDFNADNAKIDAALKAEADARATLAAQVAQKGNCRIWSTSYVGDGKYTAAGPKQLTFPGRPLAVMISGPTEGHMLLMAPNQNKCRTLAGYNVYPTWSGNRVSWYCIEAAAGQLNASGETYQVVAWLAM